MNIRAATIAPIVLFVLFAAYGYQATLIDVFPGQELEPFKPRTMPLALAVAGMLLCVVQLLQGLRAPASDIREQLQYDWRRAGLLVAAMVFYGALFTPLGFVVATSLFLAAGFAILGERRPLLLAGLPLVFTLLFWALMTRALGLYLAPGSWWQALGG